LITQGAKKNFELFSNKINQRPGSALRVNDVQNNIPLNSRIITEGLPVHTSRMTSPNQVLSF
jgi:hypothetical protein